MARCVQCALSRRRVYVYIYLVALFCHRLYTDSATIHEASRVTCNNMGNGINVSLYPLRGIYFHVHDGGISIFVIKKLRIKKRVGERGNSSIWKAFEKLIARCTLDRFLGDIFPDIFFPG